MSDYGNLQEENKRLVAEIEALKADNAHLREALEAAGKAKTINKAHAAAEAGLAE
jgi:regulator of replication initiation timing